MTHGHRCRAVAETRCIHDDNIGLLHDLMDQGGQTRLIGLVMMGKGCDMSPFPATQK